MGPSASSRSQYQGIALPQARLLSKARRVFPNAELWLEETSLRPSVLQAWKSGGEKGKLLDDLSRAALTRKTQVHRVEEAFGK